MESENTVISKRKFISGRLFLFIFLSILFLPEFIQDNFAVAASAKEGLGLALFFLFFFLLIIGAREIIGIHKNYIGVVFVFLLFILLHYGVAREIYNNEMDDSRFFFSYIYLLICIFGSIVFTTLVRRIREKSFHRIVITSYWICNFLAILVVFQIVKGKNMVFFTEPSHFSLIYLPLLFYILYFSGSMMKIFHLFFGFCISLSIQNLTLLVGLFLILILVFRLKMMIIALFITIVFLFSFSDSMDYFTQRLTFSATIYTNLSTLSYLAGWERAYLSITETYGLGIGFQQMGIIGPIGEIGRLLIAIEGRILNATDGSFTAAKLIAELGLIGILLVCLYLYYFYNIFIKLKNQKMIFPLDVFFASFYILFIINLFVRGMGYFSPSCFLFLTSIYWFYQKRDNSYSLV